MFEAIFLGILQGLTEFIPVSSSAHLRIAGEFMSKAQDPGARFTAITQIGTEIAVIIFFRRDIAEILRAWLKQLNKKNILSDHEKSEAKMGWLIILGSLPIMFLGFFARDFITKDLRSLWLIASVMIIFGIILGLADKYGTNLKSLDQLSFKHGVLYGFAQSLALLPGVSRSGATIAMGRILGYSRQAALRYSFLLALPAVFASGLLQLSEALTSEDASNVFTLPQTFFATVAAFIVGYAVIAWLLKFVSTKSFMPFIIYRIILGTTLLILLSTGVINS